MTVAERKVNIKSTDMTNEMANEAVEAARQAIEKYNVEKDIAAYIKKDFDARHGPTWHCIVGTKFGSYVTHESMNFIYFIVENLAVLLFRHG